MRVVFFGSGRLAIEPLEMVCASGHHLVGVVGRPDRLAGRGLKPAPTAVVERAREMGTVLWQPDSLSEGAMPELADSTRFDAGVVVAYGELLPRWMLSVPRFGYVNMHPSLLPRYRGAAPVERAIMNGATITGVTTIRMNERLDAGDILLHEEEPIYDDDTADTLGERLGHIGARLLVQTLNALDSNGIEPVPQEEEKATYAPALYPEHGEIDWSSPAENIDRLVRALNPTPGAYTVFRGRRVKLWSVQITDVPQEDEPGTLMNMGKEGFLVNTGTSCLRVVSLQPEGGRRMSAGEFSRGQRLLISERFSGKSPD